MFWGGTSWSALIVGTMTMYNRPTTWRDLGRSRLCSFGTCIFLFLLFLLYSLTRYEHTHDLESYFPWGDELLLTGRRPSSHRGGVPGFTVFDNVWFHDGHFHYFSDEPLPIEGQAVTKGSDSIIQHPRGELSSVLRVPKADIHRFRGETVFVNTGYMTAHAPKLLRWYYHFAGEILIGAVAALSSARTQGGTSVSQRFSKAKHDHLLDHLIIPKEDYKEKYGLSEILIEGVLGSALVNKDEWEGIQRDGTSWIRFDRGAAYLVIVDREATHTDREVGKWNKMAVSAFNLPRSVTYFEPIRRETARYLSRPAPHRAVMGKAVGIIPKVVYVDRQDNTRRLNDESHSALMGLLRDMDARREIEFVHGVFGKNALAVKDQLRVMLDADIILGVHGNGLTHQIFMAPGGVVIEMFPPGSFLRDYQLLAEAVSHTHYTIRNDTIYTRPEWEHHPGEENAAKLHNHEPEWADLIPLDHGLVSTLLRMIVVDMSHK